MELDILSVAKYINSLPEAAVWAIVDDEERTVYMKHTTNLKTKFGEIGTKIKGSSRVEIFSIPPDPVYKLIMAEKTRKEFIGRGYKIENQATPYIKFKANLRIDTDGRHAIVYITSARRHREVVGVFKKMAEAEQFYSLYYGADWGGAPVYCINEWTKRYHEKHGWRDRFYMPRLDSILTESSESVAASGSE